MRGAGCALEVELLTGDRCLRCSWFIEMPFRWRGLEELRTSTYFRQFCLPTALLFLRTATRACAVRCWSGTMIPTSHQSSSAPNSSNSHVIREHQRRKTNGKVAFPERLQEPEFSFSFSFLRTRTCSRFLERTCSLVAILASKLCPEHCGSGGA